MMKLPERLRQLRDSRGLSQAQIAKLLGIAAQTYSTYETGRTDINTDQLIALAKFYSVSTDYILGIDDSPNTDTMTELVKYVKLLKPESLSETLEYVKYLKWKEEQ